MGASMSSSFLYRIVSIVEIICSLVIAIFGVNTFLVFRQMDDDFQRDKEMIEYSAIVAVVQSILALIATFILVGCHSRLLQRESIWAQQQQAERPKQKIGRQYSLQRKAIAPTWIAWTLISIASLLFVFISPIHYCLQTESDREEMQRRLTAQQVQDVEKSVAGMSGCYSDSAEMAPIRHALRDLYSFSFIGLLFKALFVLMMYRNWKREQEMVRKVVIYVEPIIDQSEEGALTAETIATDAKVAGSPGCPTSTTEGTTATTGLNENGSNAGPGAAELAEVVAEKK